MSWPMQRLGATSAGIVLALIAGCAQAPDEPAAPPAVVPEYFGTLEPFASEAIYFVVTDRFVDGDAANNQLTQGEGEARRTFDRPITDLEGRSGNIGYLGGDYRGLLNNAAYIRDMGFTAVWITPIVNNPDEAFMGGVGLGEGFFADRGKTGYHGYWGVNFFEEDEHLISPGLAFADLTQALRDQHGLKTVLDIVCNHGSPSYTMPEDQPLFAEIYAADGTLVADHQNLHPSELDSNNPLHAFFHQEPDIAELSNNDDTAPAVLEYYVAAYLKWIEQGAAAFRIDTIRHMPHAFWKAFSDRIRAQHPGFFMFGESYDYNATTIAQHTWPENGAISVLDFPGRQRISELFEKPDMAYSHLLDYLHLDDGVYQNPYEQMIFYDNHDMPRMNASENGFIDANNWLFTSRGIPVVYYGSEVAFRAGAPEHGGNRDYFGQERVEQARKHPVRTALGSIANVRRQSVALQRGVQVNLAFAQDTAAFYRVYQKAGEHQTALVLLNKGDNSEDFRVEQWLSAGQWRDAVSGAVFAVNESAPLIETSVPPHGVRVLLLDAPNAHPALAEQLSALHSGARARQAD